MALKLFFMFHILIFARIKPILGNNLNSRDENCYTPRDIPSDNPLGCYVLKNNSVDSLNGLSSLNLPNVYRDRYGFIMDPGLCIIRCTDFLFEIAALRNGSQCQCGNYTNLTPSYTITNDSICNVKCIGNSSYYCGGEESYTVYRTKDGVLDSPFCDQKILNGTKLELASMTVNKCIDFCRQNNFEYAGLEMGTQCFCTHNYDHINQLSSDECSTSCAGDNNQICGGPLALSVYSTSNNIPLQIILPCVFAGVLLLALIATAAWIIYKRKKEKRIKGEDPPSMPLPPQDN
ncbi:10021_t:CDS:2 [Dentiscutata erythropus]|uniref:10021_t:CDS:1 n=1 Tax=Dentiscutata erythropus TaxID=1348616 RepID=A0A9N9BVW9_9GLOM|nr:10021_t:CDS:2 [Dentiscutata erythropus]